VVSPLAAKRRAAGYSQESLAHELGHDRTTIGRWERGEVEPYPWNLPPLADALGLTLAELAVLLSPEQEWQADLVDRRTFLTGFGSTLAAAAAALEQTVSLARTDDQRRSALRLLGHAHQAAGEAAFDRLALDEAEVHLHHALQVGGELGDVEMVVNAQTQLGDVARRRRRYPMALRLLEGAERHAVTASLLTRALHWQTVARAHAEMGARPAFERAIERAGEVAILIPPEHHRDGDRSPRGILLEKGQGLTLLGDPRAALEIYDQVTPPVSGAERERGSFVIIRAQALAHAGHLDAGVHLAVEGLQLARSYDSPRHVSRVQRMYDRLTATWSPREPALVELHDALAA
jgi:transcriptional regulator with XRE-family HTH domain